MKVCVCLPMSALLTARLIPRTCGYYYSGHIDRPTRTNFFPYIWFLISLQFLSWSISNKFQHDLSSTVLVCLINHKLYFMTFHSLALSVVMFRLFCNCPIKKYNWKTGSISEVTHTLSVIFKLWPHHILLAIQIQNTKGFEICARNFIRNFVS